jgi:hypothetical protein
LQDKEKKLRERERKKKKTCEEDKEKKLKWKERKEKVKRENLRRQIVRPLWKFHFLNFIFSMKEGLKLVPNQRKQLSF